MKISEVTDSIIRDYCGIIEDEADSLIEIMRDAAKAFIMGRTALSAEQLDLHEDLTAAYLILINDMYSQRDYTLSWQKQINPAADALLHMYSMNYL